MSALFVEIASALFVEVMPWIIFFIGLGGVLIALFLKLFSSEAEGADTVRSAPSSEREREDEQ